MTPGNNPLKRNVHVLNIILGDTQSLWWVNLLFALVTKFAVSGLCSDCLKWNLGWTRKRLKDDSVCGMHEPKVYRCQKIFRSRVAVIWTLASVGQAIK